MYEENFCIKRIKELMEKNGYNTYRLAKQSGISLSTLSSACNISIAQFFERSSTDLTEEQAEILSLFNSLTPKGKDMARSYLRFLTEND